jgi:hypothetical protein
MMPVFCLAATAGIASEQLTVPEAVRVRCLFLHLPETSGCAKEDSRKLFPASGCPFQLILWPELIAFSSPILLSYWFGYLG